MSETRISEGGTASETAGKSRPNGSTGKQPQRVTKPKTKVIIDSDPGVDDTIAILTALGSKELDIMAITTVGGNVSSRITQINARGIVGMAERTEIPVYAGCTHPLKRKLVTAADVHGETGVMGLELPESKAPMQSTYAVDYLIDTLKKAKPGEISIAALGPLTNIAAAIQKEPGIAKKIGNLVLMGGAFGKPAGNITPHAEFNIHVDPHAAKIVFDNVPNITVMPLDLTHQTLSTKDRRDAIRGIDSTLGPNLANMLDECARTYPGFEGIASPQHDTNCIAFLANDTLYKGVRGRVQVETDNEAEMGKTAFTLDTTGNVTVMQSVNADRFFKLVTKRLSITARNAEKRREAGKKGRHGEQLKRQKATAPPALGRLAGRGR